MIRIETERLVIIALASEQFGLILDDRRSLERSLGLNVDSAPWDEDTQDAMKWLYDELTRYPYKYPWYTSWQIISASEVPHRRQRVLQGRSRV